MPKIMTDLNFTTINGIPKDDIVNVYQIIKTASNDSQALDCICKTICDIPANNNDANFWNDKIAVKYNISPDVDIDTFYHFSAYECLISTGADSSTIKKLGIMDNSDLLVKYKLLRDTNFEFVDTFKSIEYKISKGMIDPQNTKFKDVVPDSLKDIDNPIFDTMKEMRLDDALEFSKRNSFLLSESSSRTSWLTLQKAKLTNAIRNNPDLAQIISNGGELIFAALDLMDLVDICVDIYLGFRENTMTYEEAGELIHSWGYATLFSEIGAKTGDIVGKAIGTAVGGPLGPVAGSVIGGLAGGTLGYLLGALYGSIYYDEIYHGMFNIWDLILSDGNHILYGSIEEDVFNYANCDIDYSLSNIWEDHSIVTYEIDGREGCDYIAGYKYDDVIIGGLGNDILIGCGGNDIIYGDNYEIDMFHDGCDVIYGGSGSDEIHGGGGIDIIYGDGINYWDPNSDKYIYRAPFGFINEGYEFNPYSGEDSTYDDLIYGDDGDDLIYGGIGNDTIYGGYDNDELYGEDGNDVIHGDSGNDYIDGGYGNDSLYGDVGNDVISGGAGDDLIIGGAGRDIIWGGLGNDTIYGDYDDQMYTGYNDIIDGGAGNDLIYGGGGDDTINGNHGNDTIYCGYGKDTISGGYGNDYIYGENDDDTIYGDYGDDFISGGKGDDIIYGGVGNDRIVGNEGNDTLYGEEDDDLLYGNKGRDNLYGGEGNDQLFGGDHDDLLDGGSGDDYLKGQDGNDTYIYGLGYGNDIIYDDLGNNTIKFKSIKPTDITIEYANKDDAVITIKSTEETLTIKDFRNTADCFICKFDDDDNKYKISSSENKLFFEELSSNTHTGGSKKDKNYGDFGNNWSGRLGYDSLKNASDDFNEAGKAQPPRDPLVIDLGTLGIELTDTDNGVYFDLDKNGFGNDVIISIKYTEDKLIITDFADAPENYVVQIGEEILSVQDNITDSDNYVTGSGWNDMLITFDYSEDTLTIKNYCISKEARNFTLVFADGTVVEAADQDSPLRTIYGTDGSEYMISIYEDGITKIGQDGNDQLVGSDGNDYLYGDKGDDRLTGNAGNHVLDGGEGDDYLYGGAGNDTYIFKKGYGTDIIGDGKGTNTIEIYGYSSNKIKAYRTNWNDITVTFEDSDDKLVIEGFFTSEANRNFYLTFNGGSKVYAAASNSPLRTVYGTENSDYIVALFRILDENFNIYQLTTRSM